MEKKDAQLMSKDKIRDNVNEILYKICDARISCVACRYCYQESGNCSKELIKRSEALEQIGQIYRPKGYKVIGEALYCQYSGRTGCNCSADPKTEKSCKDCKKPRGTLIWIPKESQ